MSSCTVFVGNILSLALVNTRSSVWPVRCVEPTTCCSMPRAYSRFRNSIQSLSRGSSACMLKSPEMRRSPDAMDKASRKGLKSSMKFLNVRPLFLDGGGMYIGTRRSSGDVCSRHSRLSNDTCPREGTVLATIESLYCPSQCNTYWCLSTMPLASCTMLPTFVFPASTSREGWWCSFHNVGLIPVL